MSDKLTPADVAEELSVTPTTVRNWIRSGKLTAHRIGGRIFIRRDDLEAFLNQPVYVADPKPDPGGGHTA